MTKIQIECARFSPALAKEIRENQGFDLDQMAKYLGVKKETVKRWEDGRHHPNAKSLALMSGMAGYPIEPNPKNVSAKTKKQSRHQKENHSTKEIKRLNETIQTQSQHLDKMHAWCSDVLKALRIPTPLDEASGYVALELIKDLQDLRESNKLAEKQIAHLEGQVSALERFLNSRLNLEKEHA